VNGAPVVESTAAIFDSGTTKIVGDTASIAKLFEAIDGAQSAPQFGEGTYTSAFSSAANQPRHSYNSNTIVPCTLNTSISMNVGGKEVSISPHTFNLGPISQDSDLCIAGAAADSTLTGSESVHRFPS
jgi:hypothetical protein